VNPQSAHAKATNALHPFEVGFPENILERSGLDSSSGAEEFIFVND